MHGRAAFRPYTVRFASRPDGAVAVEGDAASREPRAQAAAPLPDRRACR